MSVLHHAGCRWLLFLLLLSTWRLLNLIPLDDSSYSPLCDIINSTAHLCLSLHLFLLCWRIGMCEVAGGGMVTVYTFIIVSLPFLS